MNTIKWKGMEQEARFVWEMTKLNIIVASPTCHNLPFDFVLLFNKHWVTVQVKSCHHFTPNNRPNQRILVVDMHRRAGGKRTQPYLKTDFDYLFTSHEDKAWLIPFDIIAKNQRRFSLDQKRLDTYILGRKKA